MELWKPCVVIALQHTHAQRHGLNYNRSEFAATLFMWYGSGTHSRFKSKVGGDETMR